VITSIPSLGFATRFASLIPGHGRISTTPMDDIDRAMANAQQILDGRAEGEPEIFYQKVAEN